MKIISSSNSQDYRVSYVQELRDYKLLPSVFSGDNDYDLSGPNGTQIVLYDENRVVKTDSSRNI